jgi:DNA-binding LacI/PurR family transcriptional regulator
MANMKQIAQRAGVSLGTASHVLNDTAECANRCAGGFSTLY